MLGRILDLSVSQNLVTRKFHQRLTHSRGGNFAPIQTFLIISTCFLYLVAAGLFSKAVWDFEINAVSAVSLDQDSLTLT